MRKPIHVAVAVIKRQDLILIAKRAERLHKGGYWEFPGGKVESDESVETALIRECQEELGITPLSFKPLQRISHHYPQKDKHLAKDVLLDVWLVSDYLGVASGKEGQPVLWCSIKDLAQYEFPEANREILDLISAI